MSAQNHLVSLIVPVHNEAENIAWLNDQLGICLSDANTNYEIIYVDDGSTDNSWEVLGEIAKQDKHVHLIKFSRNFGKEAATSAGLQKCRGNAAIMLDADGQHPPQMIGDFIQAWQQGYQVVIGVRQSNQKEGLVKRYGSKVFYRTLNSMTGGGTIPRSTDFRLLDRQVINEFNRLTERNRITRGLIDWLGFKRTTVAFSAPARHSGKASYGFGKLFRLALHAFVSQTTRPLQVGGILGAITVFASAIVGLFLVIEGYFLGDPWHLAVTGTAILALFVSFLVGLVLTCQWLLALYVESIHNETQNRPLYIIEEEK